MLQIQSGITRSLNSSPGISLISVSNHNASEKPICEVHVISLGCVYLQIKLKIKVSDENVNRIEFHMT